MQYHTLNIKICKSNNNHFGVFFFKNSKENGLILIINKLKVFFFS